MKDVSAVRLYFPQSARARPHHIWHRIFTPSLSQRLMASARRYGIQQAILHPVRSGYLPGEALSHFHLENISARHPLCIELIDAEARLRDFLREHADELQQVRALLYRCEPLV
jgi:PII-like signaling protein